MNRTVLCDQHQRLNARMVDFHGWYMPVQYDGIIAEHLRTRADVSMFDTCHMGQVMVEGTGALNGLSGVLSADLRSLADGRCRYGFILNEQGGIIDDLITYRVDACSWMLVVNASTRPNDVAWLRARLPSAGIRVTDLSEERGKIDVQGPNGAMALGRALGMDLAKIPYFGFVPCAYGGDEGFVSCTGYTGEHGFEVYLPAAAIVRLWEALLAAGVKPAGLGSRDTLRLEAGLPLMGSDLASDITPVEAGLERYASKNEPFIGRDAVMAMQRNGPPRRMCGFKTAGRQSARAGNRVLVAGVAAGEVTSGSFAPTLGCAIGLAYLKTGIDRGTARPLIDIGRRQLEAEIVTLPFYQRRRSIHHDVIL